MIDQNAAARRSKIGSLSSGAVPHYKRGTKAPAPLGVDGSEAGTEALKSLLAREPVEKLESAGKFSRAKWKLQIWIKSGRSIHKPFTFTLSFWESGKRLHGGGDESAFICRRNPNAPKPVRPPFLAIGHSSTFKKEATADGCDGIIPGENVIGGFAICPDCGIRWDTEHIADSLFYVLPVEVAATVIAQWFRKLDSNCDLYLKYRDEDIRVKMMAQSYGLHEAMRHKGLMIYSLARLMRDLAGEATLESRIKAVLLA
jgi:hypothetical protein